MRVAVREIHRAPMPLIAGRRGLGDLASDCAAGNADACKQYYATVYAKAPSVIAAQTAQAAADASLPANIPPGCPVVKGSGPGAVCSINGQPILCSAVRECDPMTGAVHFEYALPFPTGNVDILEVGPSGKVVGYQGAPQGSVATTQTIPTGTVVEQGGIPTYHPSTSGSGVTQQDVHGKQQTGSSSASESTGPGPQTLTPTVVSDVKALLTNTTIGSIPNWVLLLAAAGAIYFMVKR
jgi:hypothetical protein